MIRDMQWAYRLGFKRGWKVGNRRGRAAAEPLIQPNRIKGSETDLVSCDTKSTEKQKFSDLETKVEQSEIRASVTSDVMPTNECPHAASGLISETDGILEVMDFDYCPWCGEKL